MNKVLCWLPPLAPPGLLVLVGFPANICISHISVQGEWQPATRVHQLQDFTALVVQKETGQLKLGQKNGQRCTMRQNADRVRLGIKRI